MRITNASSSLVRRSHHLRAAMAGCWCRSPISCMKVESSPSRVFMSSKADDYSKDGGLSYSERQAKMGRPLSSHVT